MYLWFVELRYSRYDELVICALDTFGVLQYYFFAQHCWSNATLARCVDYSCQQYLIEIIRGSHSCHTLYCGPLAYLAQCC